MVEWTGAHLPLVVCSAALVAAVAVMVLARLAGQRAAHQSVSGWLQQQGQRRVRLAAALGLVCAALAVFLALLDSYRDGGAVARLDHALLEAHQEHTAPAIQAAFAAITRLGDVATITALGFAVGGVLLWYRRWLLCTAWGVTLAGGGMVSTALKQLIGRQRPEAAEAVLGTTAWSFPSGHAMGATFAYGMLAYVLRRTGCVRRPAPLLGAIAALIVLIGGSRVVLQVHYPSDVVAGFAMALAWLLVCLTVTEHALRRR
ncbi:phosphatase PAP2 family protein [Aquisalimonas lutea]|uniref:phosphatase PAP2 family protein n=1 Tax=Aquisalimonas lutea TaxID=1327750 RepID=UPI0025B3F48E|nr:phosphatase PAP2 family protein [Aquisalimonas lutea]MDN3517151.1 phosphatase PAP2 family protein [Aquisalimonas lutea]